MLALLGAQGCWLENPTSRGKALSTSRFTHLTAEKLGVRVAQGNMTHWAFEHISDLDGHKCFPPQLHGTSLPRKQLVLGSSDYFGLAKQSHSYSRLKRRKWCAVEVSGGVRSAAGPREQRSLWIGLSWASTGSRSRSQALNASLTARVGTLAPPAGRHRERPRRA